MFLLGNPPDINEGPHVERPDEITKENKRVTIGTPVYVFDGYSVTIDCNAVDGTPPITITWLRNEMPIPDSEDVNTITINDPKDGDVITCRADNNIGFDNESTTLNVTGNVSTTHTKKCCTTTGANNLTTHTA